jgi:hypothetical protein
MQGIGDTPWLNNTMITAVLGPGRHSWISAGNRSKRQTKKPVSENVGCGSKVLH